MQRILFCLLFVCCCWVNVNAQDSFGRKFALLVGIDEYPGNRLYGSEYSAKKVFNLFRDSYHFAPGNMKMLLGPAATRKEIIHYLEYFQQQVKAGDMFVFYFGGHGTFFPDSKSLFRDEEFEVEYPDGKSYNDSALAPYDYQDGQGERNWCNLILDDELYNIFSAFAANKCYVLLLADTCYSGTIAKNLDNPTPAQRRANPITRGLPPTCSGKGRRSTTETRPNNGLPKPIPSGYYLALSAAQDNELAIEELDDNNQDWGLFTLKLYEAASTDTTQLTYGQLFDIVRKTTNTAARSKQHSQTPTLEKRFGGAVWLDYPFLSIPVGPFTMPPAQDQRGSWR